MAMKGYTLLPRSPELEPHNPILFNVIPEHAFSEDLAFLLRILQSANIIETSPLDYFLPYPGHSSGSLTLSAEMQSVYSAAPTVWAKIVKYLNALLNSSFFYKRKRVRFRNKISFQTFFVWALLLIVHTWNSSRLRSILLRLQCTCCTVPITSQTPHGSPLVRACQWPSSEPLSSPQLSHNNKLWA